LPKGYTLKIVLLETWGDHHYIGLNGISIYDFQGKELIKGQGFEIVADPSVIPSYYTSLILILD